MTDHHDETSDPIERPAAPRVDPLVGTLRTIASQARARLRAERVREVVAECADAGAFLLGIPALLHIAAALLFGVSLFSLAGLILWSVIPPLFFLGMATARVSRTPIDDATAIAEVDRALGLEDRLIAAHEFLALPERGPFHEAAIADARLCAETANARGLPDRPMTAVSGIAKGRAVGAAMLILVAATFAENLVEPAPATTSGGEERTVAVAERAAERTDEHTPPPVEPTPPRDLPPRTVEQNPAATEPGGQRSGELSDDVKKALGKTTSGKSSAAASSSGKSQSKGAPSNQSQSSSESPEKSKRKQKEPKEGQQKESEPTPPKEPEEMSGSTAGRGAASGSSKSPSASKWASKDQVTSEDEEDLEDDEEVDDEFDNSDARGGVQPNLRDRKPPVNRDLSIGFGNGKNPDANGRGGPSEQKKSRGVAALVLGVPIPDHVKGCPNPGKTKITQERVEPQEEDAPAVAAADRGARGEGIGHVARPDLLPWMQTMVERYYATLRARTPLTPDSAESDTSGTPAGSSTKASPTE